MATPNKKKENCLDILSKQFPINLICTDVLAKNIIRIIKDIAYGNITKDDFEKYGEFFTSRQNLVAFKNFALNRKLISDVYVETFNEAIKSGKNCNYQMQMQQMQAPIMQQQPIQQVPVQPMPPIQQASTNLWGSIIGQQQQPIQAPVPNYAPAPQQIYQQPIAQMAIGNTFDLNNNGLFAQIYDVECRKNNLWTHIYEAYRQFDENFEMFVTDYIRQYLGFQSSLNNRFRRDFSLLDK